jgi:hypothetical protein
MVTLLLQAVVIISLLTIFTTMLIKTFLHFRLLRIKQGKVGDFADYVNVSFRWNESITYLECAMPVPILSPLRKVTNC